MFAFQKFWQRCSNTLPRQNDRLAKTPRVVVATEDSVDFRFRNKEIWAGTRTLQEQVLEARARLLGKKHPDTLTSMNNMASLY